MVDFGGGCRSRSSCDRGKTKSTPGSFDLDWKGLGLEFDKKQNHATIFLFCSNGVRVISACEECLIFQVFLIKPKSQETSMNLFI